MNRDRDCRHTSALRALVTLAKEDQGLLASPRMLHKEHTSALNVHAGKILIHIEVNKSFWEKKEKLIWQEIVITNRRIYDKSLKCVFSKNTCYI